MKLAYTILELDRKENAEAIRKVLAFLPELKSNVCDARKEYPECISEFTEFRHIFRSITNLGYIGLWVSTLRAFYNFLDSEYDAILILEDDAWLIDNFEFHFKEVLLELPQNFGLLSIGYRNIYRSHFSYEHHIDEKKYICRLFQGGDSWGILYNKIFIQEILEVLKVHPNLRGISDTAILSYAQKNVTPATKLNSYSINPKFGSMILENHLVSSIANSKNI